MRSFIVCGPQSSGNRLVAAILTRAGLSGSGSTDQPTDYNINYSKEWVIINHWNRIREWIAYFNANGHQVTMLIPIREAHACASSMVKTGHASSYESALKHINTVVAANLSLALIMGMRVELIPYSSLSTPGMVKQFLIRHGLRNDNLEEPLPLVGQIAPPQPENLDKKHYAEA